MRRASDPLPRAPHLPGGLSAGGWYSYAILIYVEHGMANRIGFLIPEFPGQTHIWMWREIRQLRAWGVPIRIFSTRRPPDRDRARHAFASEAQKETTYLWPVGLGRLVAALSWAALTRPVGLARCLRLALDLPTTDRPRALRLIALIAPACLLARACRDLGVDHLHSQSCANSAVLCMMVKRLNGIPYSLILNANVGWWGGAMRQKFGEAQFTMTHTQWLLDEIRRDFPDLGPAQTALGRIGVETSVWVPRGRRPPESGIRIVCVARLHPTKAQDVLLDAVALLASEGRTSSVRIVGEGPSRADLEARTRRLGLEGTVEFTGSLGQEQIIELMQESDVFVLPSRWEPLGVAYMEAMSMELATIGTTAGGVREIIDDGVDGILVPPDDPRALADAIAKLAADPGLRARMGRSGREKILSKFDSRVGAAMLYERLLGTAPPGGGAPPRGQRVAAAPAVSLHSSRGGAG